MSSASETSVGGVDQVFGLSKQYGVSYGHMPIPGAYSVSMPMHIPPPQTSTPVAQGGPAPTPATLPRLSDEDVLRIAMTTKSLLAQEVTQMIKQQVAPIVKCCIQLANDNKLLHQQIDDLEMYSRRNCVRIFGVAETETDTDKVVLDIAQELEVPLSASEVVVSHRVGRPSASSSSKPRAIIARISNYGARHQLLKESKNLHKIQKRKGVYINQDLTKTRNKLAYEARQLVKLGKAKSSFVWDGKIFVVDNKDHKHKILCLDDLIETKRKICPDLLPTDVGAPESQLQDYLEMLEHDKMG